MLRFSNPIPLYIVDTEAERDTNWLNLTKVKCLDTGKFYQLKNGTFAEASEIDSGLKGDKGDPGIQGLPGSDGAQGIPGVKGDTGLQGIQGIQGVPGVAPTPVVTALATTGSIVVPMADADVFTITPAGACTFTTTSFKNGKRVTFMILTSGTTARTMTWSIGFKPLSTLSTGTVTAKRFSQTFLCVGNLWIETGARLAAV